MLIIRENFHIIFYKTNKFTIFFNKNLVNWKSQYNNVVFRTK